MTILLLTLRNLRIFFRDRVSVLFSLLGVFIIIGLYVLFLGNVMMKSMADMGGETRFLLDSWVMAGLLGVASLTTTMGAFGIMVEDRQKKVMRDFYTSPVRRAALTGGYVFSSFLVGMAMCVLTLVLAELYIVANGGELLSLRQFAEVFAVLLLSVLSSSALVFFIVSFFKSSNAFATASTILGTLVGFLTGIYIPIGDLPSSVQTAIKLFPVSHAVSLLRQIMMETPFERVFRAAPAGVSATFQSEMGVLFSFGSHTMSSWENALVLGLTAAVFYGLAIWNLSRRNAAA